MKKCDSNPENSSSVQSWRYLITSLPTTRKSVTELIIAKSDMVNLSPWCIVVVSIHFPVDNANSRMLLVHVKCQKLVNPLRERHL